MVNDNLITTISFIGSTCIEGPNHNGPKRDYVLKLMETKEKIERDIADHQEILKTNNIGMRESLVDLQGYPRNDVDVFAVRQARHKIIVLQNDLKKIMGLIEKGLEDVHWEHISKNKDTRHTFLTLDCEGHADSGPQKPFAVVTSVETGSPADTAGLVKNDMIIRFGSLLHQNFTDVSQIAALVSHSVGQQINVQVSRARHVLTVTLTPRPWANPGLLGCYIQKITE